MLPAHPGRLLAKIEAIAEHYQVPLLADEIALEEYALACGYKTMPADLLPDPEAPTRRMTASSL